MNRWHRERRGTVSRRAAILHASGVGLGAATATAGGRGAFAQAHATPAAGTIPPVVEAWIAAYQARDTAAMAALYTADAVYEDVPNSFVARGDEIPQFLATAEQGFSNVRVEVLNVFGGPGWGAVEYLFSATNSGIVPDPAAAGRSFTSRGDDLRARRRPHPAQRRLLRPDRDPGPARFATGPTIRWATQRRNTSGVGINRSGRDRAGSGRLPTLSSPP